MYTLDPSTSDVHHLAASGTAGPSAEIASAGFLGILAFAVTIMLASFALELLLGLAASAFRLIREVLSALTVAVLACAVLAVVAGVAIVSVRGR
jgi:hypothetical protein